MGELTVRTQRGIELCSCCSVADRPLSRMRGLLGRDALEPGEGLLLRPCSSVHTWFMSFPIDVVFVDSRGVVVRVVDSLRPWRFAARRGAAAVLELPAGTCAASRLAVGDSLSLPAGGEAR